MIRCRSAPHGVAKILKHISHRSANQLIEPSVVRAERLCQYPGKLLASRIHYDETERAEPSDVFQRVGARERGVGKALGEYHGEMVAAVASAATAAAPVCEPQRASRRVVFRRVSRATGSWDYWSLVGRLRPASARRCAPPNAPGSLAFPASVVNTDARKRNGLCAVGRGPSVLRTTRITGTEELILISEPTAPRSPVHPIVRPSGMMHTWHAQWVEHRATNRMRIELSRPTGALRTNGDDSGSFRPATTPVCPAHSCQTRVDLNPRPPRVGPVTKTCRSVIP